jgi:hypothetical protein
MVMLRNMLACAAVMLIFTLAARGGTKEDFDAAVDKLSENGFSWTTAVEGGSGAKQEGKMQKDGLTMLTIILGDLKVESYFKEGKGAINTVKGWQSLVEARTGPARGIVRVVENFKGPAKEAKEMAAKAPSLQKTDDGYASEMTPEWVTEYLIGRPGPNSPQVSNAKGSIKFVVKDGALSKLTYHVEGTISANGRERKINTTTITEITGVGNVAIDVPSEAKEIMKGQ